MSKITEYDAITGQATERNLTDAELAQRSADLLETENQNKAKSDKDTARQVVLDRLGITAHDAALLLG